LWQLTGDVEPASWVMAPCGYGLCYWL